MNIRLSPKHGVNPSIDLCPICGKENGSLILPGRLPNDAESPVAAVWTDTPCDECVGFMEKGIILIQVRDGEEGKPNPHRTGFQAVVTEAAMRKIAKDPTPYLKSRRAYMEQSLWRRIGLPEVTS